MFVYDASFPKVCLSLISSIQSCCAWQTKTSPQSLPNYVLHFHEENEHPDLKQWLVCRQWKLGVLKCPASELVLIIQFFLLDPDSLHNSRSNIKDAEAGAQRTFPQRTQTTHLTHFSKASFFQRNIRADWVDSSRDLKDPLWSDKWTGGQIKSFDWTWPHLRTQYISTIDQQLSPLFHLLSSTSSQMLFSSSSISCPFTYSSSVFLLCAWLRARVQIVVSKESAEIIIIQFCFTPSFEYQRS